MTTPANHKLTLQVQQWLHRVIAPEYADPQRTYNDVATALFNTPSLSPRTEVYTHEDGRPELLLHLHGTIPVLFRGASYNIPLTIWLPHIYPRQPPMAFVTPAKDMLIRPGNHVDPSGKCYHPYLANWVNYSDRSNVVDLCDVLRGVFGREPPVYSKTVPPVVRPAEAAPPPLPPLPDELTGRAEVSATPTPVGGGTPVGPPPLPPLPREITGRSPSLDGGVGAGGRFPGYQSPSPPPLPPAPPIPLHPNAQHQQQQQQRPLLPPGGNMGVNGQGRGPPVGYTGGGPPPPPLPPAPHRASGTPQLQAPPYSPPGSAGPYHPPPFHQTISPAPPPHPPIPHHPHHLQRPPQTSPPPPQMQPYHHPPPPPQHYHPQFQQPHPNPPPPPPPPPPAPKRPDPIDIMSLPQSSPTLVDPTTSETPPPLPPNPETALLLSKITTALHTLATTAHTSLTTTTLPQTLTQRESLTRTHTHMSQELQDLARLRALCAQDSEILKERVAAAEGVIRDAETREVPGVDAVVVGVTVVHSQLYELVTEDRAIEDTIYVLGKALDRERISLEVFLKHTRTLAREQFLLRALVKKIIGQIGIEE